MAFIVCGGSVLDSFFCLRIRSALEVNCCVIIYCLEVSCKEVVKKTKSRASYN